MELKAILDFIFDLNLMLCPLFFDHGKVPIFFVVCDFYTLHGLPIDERVIEDGVFKRLSITKVNQLEMFVLGNQDVFRLQVPMHYLQVEALLQCLDDLRGKEDTHGAVQSALQLD